MKCRHCGAIIEHTMIDLGSAPPSNSYLTSESLFSVERWYPLRVRICTECWLAQTEDYTGREEFFSDDYAYFSSCSSTWLTHCREYVQNVKDRFGLGSDSMVVEVAANDGYLLQYVKESGIPCYGIEPTKSTALMAEAKGLEIYREFFGISLANRLSARGKMADLIVANNVLAHVPDINDFAQGFAHLLKPQGVGTFEFPHIVNLIEHNQFDTIYHEHYSYLSLTSVKAIFESSGLQVFDIEKLPTHGGSLRVYVQRKDAGKHGVASSVAALLLEEDRIGVKDLAWYTGLQTRAKTIKMDLLRFLLDANKEGKSVAAYGAAAKGNTLLNFCGIHDDLISFVCDAAIAKQGKYLPGSRIPILEPKALKQKKPDYIIILPWNIKNEIVDNHSYIKDWGAKFVIAIPDLRVFYD